MKNIAVFAYLVSIAASSYGITVHAGSGILYGSAQELVYAASSSSRLLSELVWPMEPLAYWELGLGYEKEAAEGFSFFAEAIVRFGISGETGTMTDTDWMSDDGYKTHYSAHECVANRALFGDYSFGFSFPLPGRTALSPVMKLSTMTFSWTARDGYTQYGSNTGDFSSNVPWSSSFPRLPVAGDGILYTQDWLILAFGLDFSWKPTERLQLRARFLAAPFIICGAQDDHLMRTPPLRFEDVMAGGYGIEPSVRLAYRLYPRWVLVFAGDYRLIGSTRGDTSQKVIGSDDDYTVYEDTAGAGYSALTMGLSLRFDF